MRQMLAGAALLRPAFVMPDMRGTLGAWNLLRMQPTNPALERLAHFPLDGCVSAVLLSPETKRIVTVFKDRGEQQLSGIIARHMANVLPPSWQAGAALVPIPARINAVRERGFDHVLLIGAELSRMTGMPLTPLLRARPRRDQRNLDAKQRLANMVGSFDLEPNAALPYRSTLKTRLASAPASY